MRHEISILLPSLRPKQLTQVIEEFEVTNNNVDYQIIAVSPFRVQAPKVKWIYEDTQRGSVWATNVAYVYSEGKYAVYFSDDVSPTKDCLKNMLIFMKDKEVPFIGAFKMLTPSGKEIGPFKVFEKQYACYGCLSEKTEELVGGIFYKDFKYSWCDCDLALRVFEKGGKIETCQNACVIPRQIEDNVYINHRKTFNDDWNAFTNLWYEKLGNGIPKEMGVINHR